MKDEGSSTFPSSNLREGPSDRSPTRIEALEVYDIDRAILDIWLHTVGPHLLPVQTRAIKEFSLFSAGNLVVSSPSQSGKTFLGEMAAVKAASTNSRVLYLVHDHPRAETRSRELQQRYAAVGIDVLLSCRNDRRDHDVRLHDQPFELGIIDFMTLRSLLVSEPNVLTEVGLVVIDELQRLADSEHSATLELLLTKLGMAPSQPRLIALSTNLDLAEQVAEWLDADLLVEERRPVELRKGVLCQGEFRYREHNSGMVGREPFRNLETKNRSELMLAAAQELAERGEQVVLFAPESASATSLAQTLAFRVAFPAATASLAELQLAEPTYMSDALLQSLQAGVAFHHAEMTADEREIVERAFRNGHVAVLVATSTSPANLTASNVILDGRRWEGNGAFGRPALVPLGKSEYESLSGRAARPACSNGFGRSLLVTHSSHQAESWFGSCACHQSQAVVLFFKKDHIADTVIDLVASGMAKSRQELADILRAGFAGRVCWTATLGRKGFAEAIGAAIDGCIRLGLIRQAGDDELATTRIGNAAALHAIDAPTAAAFAGWARSGLVAPPTTIETLTLLGQSPAGGAIPVGSSYREKHDVDYKRALLGRLDQAWLRDRPVFQRYTSSPFALEDDEAITVRKALMLQDWIDELPIRELEQRYEVWAGAIRRIAERYSWLCEGLAAICAACGWERSWHQSIQQLAVRLVFGAKEDPSVVMRLAEGECLPLIPSCAGDLGPKAANTNDEAAAAATPDAPTAPTDKITPDVAVDLVVDLPRQRLILWSVEISVKRPRKLQPQLFFALAALAFKAGTTVSMDEIADEVQRLRGLRRRPIPPETKDLRYRLVKALGSALGDHASADRVGDLFESVQSIGLRLNCTAKVLVTRS